MSETQPQDRTDQRARGAWATWLVSGLWGIVYAATASKYVQGGDNGEFATLLARGGVAHPPGFPLYVLYLRAVHGLPAASPAHAAALATALLGALSVLMLQRSAIAWGASSRAAILSAALYGGSSLAWHLSTHAEVFAPNALVAVTIAWLAADGGPLRGWRRVGALGLAAGLGLGIHPSIVLTAPLGLYGVYRGLAEDRKWATGAMAGVGALGIGLASYLSILWFARDPDAGWVWRAPDGVTGLVQYFLRKEYGTFQLAAGDQPVMPARHVVHLAAQLVTDLMGLPLICLVAAGKAVWRKRSARVLGRAPVNAIILAFLLAGPVFVSVFNLPLAGIALRVVERFYLLPQILCCLLIALSLDALIPQVLRRLPFAAGLTAAVSAVGVLLHLQAIQQDNGPSVDDYLRDTLAFVAPRALIFGTGDHRLFGFVYAREALGLRQDAQFIDPVFDSPSYRRWVRSTAGLDVPPDRMLSSRDLVAAALKSGRPVYATDLFDRCLQDEFVMWPEGTLLRILPAAAHPPPIRAIEERNLALLNGFQFEGVTERQIDTWAGGVCSDYARPWFLLSQAYGDIGMLRDSARCRGRGLAIFPWYEQVTARAAAQ